MPAAKNSPAGAAPQEPVPGLVWLVGDRLLTLEWRRSLIGDAEVVRLDGRRLDIAALAREIDTLPLFVEHKWILVQDFKVPGRRGSDEADDGGKAEPEGDKLLMAALGRIGASTTVILQSEAGDRRTKLYKLVQDKGRYVELASFKEYETGKFAEWVTGRLRAEGKTIPMPIALEFVEAVGPDLAMLASEVEKLCTAMGSETTVTDQSLEVIAGSPVALRRFIEEGLMRKQPARAEALLHQTLDSNEHPLRILNFLIPRFRDLLKARLLPDGRRDPQKASAVLGAMHPYRLKSLYEEADRFTSVELREAIHSLVLADTCLKSSVDDRRVMSLLTAALTGAITHAAFARTVASYVEPWD